MRHGAVATGHPRVTDAAARVLAEGGNAFDAAVAAGFAAAVAEPMFTSLGGGGFLLARGADGSARLLDFFVDTPGRGRDASPDGGFDPHFVAVTVDFPASSQQFKVGLGSVAVPGTLAGLLEIQMQLGRLPLAAVIEPAVELARGGVEVTRAQAYSFSLLLPINTLTPAGTALYAPGGRSPVEGDRLFNRDLAAFLESLPGSADDFYRGGLAARMADDMRASGGLLTKLDLAAFRTLRRQPLAFDYRGHRILTNPPPSFGGSLIADTFGRLAAADSGAGLDTAEGMGCVARVMREVEESRAAAPDGAGPRFSRGTTHISIGDAEGNAASMTLSNGEGSGYVAPGSGIMLNNMLGEDDLHPEGFHTGPPGLRVASMMSPSLALRDDRVRLIVGSGGSKRIRTAVVQVVERVLVDGSGIEEAVGAPRIHWDGVHLHAEPGLPADTLAALGRDWELRPWPERNLYFGGVQAVAWDGDTASAAGDPRRGGAAAVV